MENFSWSSIKFKYPCISFNALLKRGYNANNNLYLLRNLDSHDDWIINKSMFTFLKFFNGTNTLENIVNLIQEKYPYQNVDIIKENVTKTLESLYSSNIYQLKDAPSNIKLRIFEKVFDFPLEGLSIALTNRCNFSCKYCFIEKTKPTDLPKDKYFSLINEAVKGLGIIQVGLTGGEPLLIKDLPYLIEYASKLACQVTVLTNGYLLTKEYLHTLKDAGLYKLSISFDSDSPEIFDYLTDVPNSYKVVLENISYAASIGMHINVSVVLLKGINDNKNNFVNLTNKLQKIGVESISYTNMFSFGKALNMKEYILEPEKLAELNEIFNKSRVSIKNCHENLDLDIFSNYKNSIYQRDLYRAGICDIGTGILHILPDGRITPCPSFPNLIIGYVGKDKLSRLWSNSDILKKLRKFKSSDISECSTCQMHDWCNGGCRARAFYDTGNMSSPDRWACAMYKNYLKNN
jgi:radical SAM protein with 4Fe4S-binding SPASM domain